ncbi:MAG: T9SS type A sorting domain-containing protein, partial [Tannerella sp.]|nr:T9SS type A sorting domain-containing protein [Tannerella sp.]
INDFEAVAIRNEWRYDDNGRLSEYGKNIGAERNAARISYLYDENGNLTQELYLSRSGNGWREAGKYTYTANESVSMYYAADRWITDVIVKTSYDIDGKLVRTDYYSADGSRLQAYCTYLYDDAQPVATITDIINVYPNPVIDECAVNVPESLIGLTISLFDSYGKQVITTLASNNPTTINTASLPSGIYYLKIGNLTGKVIKK